MSQTTHTAYLRPIPPPTGPTPCAFRLEDEGNTIVSRQCCKHFASGRTAVQYLVGDWLGLHPPPGHV